MRGQQKNSMPSATRHTIPVSRRASRLLKLLRSRYPYPESDTILFGQPRGMLVVVPSPDLASEHVVVLYVTPKGTSDGFYVLSASDLTRIGITWRSEEPFELRFN